MHNLSEMPTRLAAFLALNEPEVDHIEVTSYEPMTGGYSRILAKAVTVWTSGATRTTRTFVLRGDPPADKALIVTDRSQEFAVLRAVEGAVSVSRAHYLDATGEHLGTPALVLDHVDAASLLPHMAGRDDAANADLARPLAEAAAAFHTIPLDALPPELARPANWDAYIADRIDEWRRTAHAHVESMPILRYVAAWLDAHRPPPVELALVHGDFQSANLMRADDGRLVVLDWELALIGDPREDIGYFKAVATAAPPDVTALDEAAFYGRYRELTGMTEEQINPAIAAYFLVLGVIGTVRRLVEGGAAYAKGENTALGSAFSLSSVMFGQSMWMAGCAQLEMVFDAAKSAAGGAS